MSNPNTDIHYPAKLLLIGEYTVLHNQPALAIPLDKYSGHFELNGLGTFSHSVLLDLCTYLTTENIPEFDCEKFEAHLDNGLQFISTIPQGYGVGSSGALVAAVFDQYFINKTSNLEALKSILGRIESFFHGSSSGLDPLVSYTRSGILLTADGFVNLINKPNLKDLFFLIDTGIERKTEKLVNQYMGRYNSDQIFRAAMKKLADHNSDVINALIKYDKVNNDLSKKNEILETFKKISSIQLRHMSTLIPDNFISHWASSIDADNYSIKLNGAGGGGYLLGYTIDIESTIKETSIEEIEIIIL